MIYAIIGILGLLVLWGLWNLYIAPLTSRKGLSKACLLERLEKGEGTLIVINGYPVYWTSLELDTSLDTVAQYMWAEKAIKADETFIVRVFFCSFSERYVCANFPKARYYIKNIIEANLRRPKE